MNSKEPSILMIYTGGTIGMILDPVTGRHKPFELDHLIHAVPELARFNFDIHTRSFGEPIDSSDVQPQLWSDLARVILEKYDDYDGFVILHGTDTMAFTASALSFMIPELDKPVILTGSQLPIGMIRTDGKENLITALQIAASKNSMGAARVPEVAIYFDSFLFRGNRSHKSSTQHLNAFSSPNMAPLAEAGVQILFYDRRILPPSTNGLSILDKYDDRIGVLPFFPGMSPDYYEPTIKNEQTRALMLMSYGSGQAPNDRKLLKLLKDEVDRGKIIVNVTQCAQGMVDQTRYENGARLHHAGVIGARDLTYEAALTKLMVLLANFPDHEVAERFTKSWRGELTES
ncbi:asparaginase [bacterium SCSIO 12741]|nr:asparaginase [bacterium SCSIO 12741]